jgi:hypothetical protein
MQKGNFSEIDPEVLYLSEDLKTKNEEENVKKETESLELKLKLLLIPEYMNVLLSL